MLSTRDSSFLIRNTTSLVKGLRAVAQFVAKHDLLIAALVATSLVLISAGIGWENNKVVPVNGDIYVHYSQPAVRPLASLANWDGPSYLTIASQGYTSSVQASFFPLYPLAIHGLMSVFRSELYTALLLSWISLTGAIYFFIKIIKQLYKGTNSIEALRAVLLFVLFPTGVFLVAVYTESLFAFLSLGAVYFALQKRYIPATVMALLSTATHINGVFVVALVAAIAYEQKLSLKKIFGILAIGSLGILAYLGYSHLKFHDALAVVHAQKAHGWLHYGFLDYATAYVSLKGLFYFLVVASVIYWWKRRKSFALYAALYLGIPLLGGIGAFGRYALIIFPFQIMMYEILRDRKTAYAIVLALTSVLWAYYTLQFTGGYSGG